MPRILEKKVGAGFNAAPMVRVRDTAANEAVPVNAQVVPDNSPLTDWLPASDYTVPQVPEGTS